MAANVVLTSMLAIGLLNLIGLARRDMPIHGIAALIGFTGLGAAALGLYSSWSTTGDASNTGVTLALTSALAAGCFTWRGWSA